MKLQTSQRISTTGHVLWMVLVCTALIGLALVGYLKLTQTRTTLTARSQVWNNCMPILEAGVEEALAQLNRYADSNLAANGWTAVSGGFYKERSMAEGYYRVSVSYTNISSPTIISTGYVPAPPTLASANPWFVAQGFAPDPNLSYISRTVRVTCQREPLLNKAMVAKDLIDFKGNNVWVDSYDSTNPNFSGPQGQYDPAKRHDKGEVAINSGELVNVGTLGNANIMGTVHMGPKANFTLSAQGTVGDMAWVTGGNLGVQDGAFRRDADFNLPDVSPPWTGGAQVPLSAPGFKYLLADGNYELSKLTLVASEAMRITGKAVLYVTGDVDLRGTLEIVAPGTLTIYVGGAKTVFGGRIVKPPLPKDFLYFGLPSNVSVDIKASDNTFNGIIYAPNAFVNILSQSYICGCIVGRTINFNGNAEFHYDESLAKLAYKGYVMTSWTEI